MTDNLHHNLMWKKSHHYLLLLPFKKNSLILSFWDIHKKQSHFYKWKLFHSYFTHVFSYLILYLLFLHISLTLPTFFLHFYYFTYFFSYSLTLPYFKLKLAASKNETSFGVQLRPPVQFFLLDLRIVIKCKLQTLNSSTQCQHIVKFQKNLRQHSVNR